MKASEVVVTGTDADGYTVRWSMADEDRGAASSTHELDDDWIFERYVKELRGDDSNHHLPCFGSPLRDREEFHASGRCGRLEGLKRPQAMDVADMAASILNDWMAHEIVSRVHVEYTDQPCKA